MQLKFVLNNYHIYFSWLSKLSMQANTEFIVFLVLLKPSVNFEAMLERCLKYYINYFSTCTCSPVQILDIICMAKLFCKQIYPSKQ